LKMPHPTKIFMGSAQPSAANPLQLSALFFPFMYVLNAAVILSPISFRPLVIFCLPRLRS
jgi:hypothetical protein